MSTLTAASSPSSAASSGTAAPASHVLGDYADQLSAEQIAHFNDQGYLVCPGWIPGADLPRLKQEVETWSNGGVDDRYGPPAAGTNDRTARQMDFPGHWDLMTHPSLMRLLTQILGPGFAHHHLHTARHLPGDKGVAWHHDYEQHPQTNRSHGMVHTFWYLNGLDGTIGDLLVIPGSHRMVLERNTLGVWGFTTLPGTKVISEIPPGTMVIVHSAALHARCPKAGGDPSKPRFFIDSSYCQAGIRWPNGSGWLKAHARAMADGRATARGVEHLFDPNHFYSTEGLDWTSFRQINQGSLLPQLLGK